MSKWVIIASGESATPVQPGDYQVMTINSSWRLCPWADVHYSNDHDWWAHELPNFQGTGRRMCGFPYDKVPGTDQEYTFEKNYRGLCMLPGKIAWGGNSGYAGINLAIQLGATTIYLVGYDMCGKAHWHEDHHTSIRKAFNFPMWLQRFEELARDAKRRGIEIFNCSDRSALKCFPKKTMSFIS